MRGRAELGVITGACFVAFGILFLSGVSMASPGRRSPAATLKAILAAGQAQRSVHYVGVSRAAGMRLAVVADVARTHGVLSIAFNQGRKHGHTSVIVFSRVAYVRGDAFTLARLMGFYRASVARYANRWLRIPSGHPAYAVVTDYGTLPKEIKGLYQGGVPTEAPPIKIGGKRVIGVQWKVPSEPSILLTLYARSSGIPLPVEERGAAGDTKAVIAFSDWNRPIRIVVPKSAVAVPKSAGFWSR